MLLKKQTVWLLTMLSLIIVLSVYYITSPSQTPSDLAAYQNDEEGNKTATNETEGDEVGSVVSSLSTDDAFVALRMQIDEERAKMSQEYTEIIANSNISEEIKHEAYEDNKALSQLRMKESTLEMFIANMGYHDVLVNTMDDVVEVLVKTDKELTKKEANEIMLKAMEELGEEKTVSVKYYSMNK
jgi:stage III sporulation protein AH